MKKSEHPVLEKSVHWPHESSRLYFNVSEVINLLFYAKQDTDYAGAQSIGTNSDCDWHA